MLKIDWSFSLEVEKGNLADSDGSKDSSLESNEFRSYGRNDSTFLKEVSISILVPYC